ncbi:MAG: pirin family protein [Candidatus Hydrogenedentes bacterium]|nr:pirin family protein [Candidatus Hydrogenedentota bacterium]
MLTIRRANERGHADHGWLDSHHTFSFANYYDPKHMGFRSLRVLNDDIIQGGGGFPFHAHDNMEIFSYVTEGALEHKDSMGNGSVLRRGDVQLMSAGTGVQHSEFNHLNDAPTHLYQIWIRPAQKGLEPNYQERHYADVELADQLKVIVSPDGRDGSLVIRQDATIYAGRLAEGTTATLEVARERHIWVQVLSGSVTVDGEALDAGDAAARAEAGRLEITASTDTEVLVFDLN